MSGEILTEVELAAIEAMATMLRDTGGHTMQLGLGDVDGLLATIRQHKEFIRRSVADTAYVIEQLHAAEATIRAQAEELEMLRGKTCAKVAQVEGENPGLGWGGGSADVGHEIAAAIRARE